MEKKEKNAETTAEEKKKAGLRSAMREKTGGYIITSLGLVAGLAWNDAISTTIKYYFPLDQNTAVAKLIYAVLVTMLVVLLSEWLIRIFTPKDK